LQAAILQILAGIRHISFPRRQSFLGLEFLPKLAVDRARSQNIKEIVDRTAFADTWIYGPDRETAPQRINPLTASLRNMMTNTLGKLS
jgi:hypothetical protein